ncbi:MAG TPA: molybdopterin-dependent oxidoreductase [Pseudonocardiaceae bacterium]|nr:molybdopterin-dependent oxidoreductase [Pseudonocardiaceae bacterium]
MPTQPAKPPAAPARDGPEHAFPEGFWRALERRRPPGLNRIAWRSPLRGRWLTSVFGAVLLACLPLVILTGLLDYIAYGPQFHQAIPGNVGWLRLPLFDWPTRPAWLFRLTQGLHVGLGLVLVPVLLAKLWSVVPKLFAWPPARSLAHVLERVSLLFLVGGILFEIVTGVLNIQYDYVFGFSFYTAHYFGAWVFTGAFVVHVALKFPIMVRALRSRSPRAVLRTSRADTKPEPADDSGLVAPNPRQATLSRRGALALVGGGSALVAVLTVGQTVGGFTRQAAVLLPRGRSYGSGPNAFQVNRTARSARITAGDVGSGWQLSVRGGPSVLRLDRDRLLVHRQYTADLPIACVEGWSSTQSWSGVRLGDLAALSGVAHVHSAVVTSLERAGAFRRSILTRDQVLDPDSLLALRVNGADLSVDHGYPARVIVPALPGVHCTKWVASIEFRSTGNA